MNWQTFLMPKTNLKRQCAMILPCTNPLYHCCFWLKPNLQVQQTGLRLAGSAGPSKNGHTGGSVQVENQITSAMIAGNDKI